MAAKRLLYISGSIGLGHAARDIAIARELRRLQPELEIDWLAGQPAAQLIEEAGETVLAESAAFADTGFAESAAGDFSLNLVRYVLRASGAWARSARAFLKLTAERSYDFVVADEFYALTIAFGLMPKLKKVPLAMIYDFLGVDAMGRNPLDRALVHALNRIWSGGRRGSPPPFDLTLFVGEPEDIADRPFGYRLPNRQDYGRRHFHFLGYTLPFDRSSCLTRCSSERGWVTATSRSCSARSAAPRSAPACYGSARRRSPTSPIGCPTPEWCSSVARGSTRVTLTLLRGWRSGAMSPGCTSTWPAVTSPSCRGAARQPSS